MEEPYSAPEGALSVAAAMRIACYCRHQSEKEGFQVIFTLKDQQGNVVAQAMSDSILITDDHKTHPPALTTMSSDMLFHPAHFQPNGLPTSYSMMDLPSHAQPFTSSRSTGNLHALAYGQQPQFNPHSHVHQLPNNAFASQATSATMTPTSLSRPGSPTSAGQVGPNKKRKSSSFHKRVPSGLQMTPRVDTSQPLSANIASGVSIGSNFSPTGAAFAQQNDQSYMTIPNNSGPAQYFGSGPPTPAHEGAQFAFGQNHQLDIARAQNASAYFSHPSSAVPSRSNSPVMPHSRPNMSAYARQPIQTPTNHVSRASQIFWWTDSTRFCGKRQRSSSSAYYHENHTKRGSDLGWNRSQYLRLQFHTWHAGHVRRQARPHDVLRITIDSCHITSWNARQCACETCAYPWDGAVCFPAEQQSCILLYRYKPTDDGDGVAFLEPAADGRP